MSELQLSRSDGVATITINRPDRLGALSLSMVNELGDLLRSVRADQSIRVLVMRGTGKGFIAGADLEEYDGATTGEFDGYQRLSRATFSELEELPQPTIAAVNGYALGGGFEVALCCDMIIASTNARFGLPEVRLGLIPGGGATQRLSRAIGARRAKELIMTGRMIETDEAESLGLLTHCTTPEAHEEVVGDVAHKLASGAPLAIQAVKRVVRNGERADFATGLDVEQAELRSLFETRDGREGVRAFLHKEKPEFTGR